MQLGLNPLNYNPLYWHLRKVSAMENVRIVFCMGGSSSGKSYGASQISLESTFYGENILVFRKEQATARDTIIRTFQDAIKNLFLEKEFKYNKSDHFYTNLTTGAEIHFSGLDKEGKIKGLANFQKVIWDEADQMNIEEFDQMKLRLRGAKHLQFWLLWNPIDEMHWLKTYAIDNITDKHALPLCVGHPWDYRFTEIAESWRNSDTEIEGEFFEWNTVFLKTTYRNNYWINGSPDFYLKDNWGDREMNTIRNFHEMKTTNPVKYAVYANAEWGRLTDGTEFYKSFNASIHTRSYNKCKYDPLKPLHISFDENVNPYLPFTVWQVSGKEYMQIDEFCLVNPNNTIKQACKRFAKEYTSKKHRAKVYVYGDATSKKEDVKIEKGANLFTLIERFLKEAGFEVILRIDTSNPRVRLRGEFINDILQDNYGGYSIVISDKCKESIKDIRYVKENNEGGKLKEMVKNAKTGKSYQEYGHCTDAMDYFLCVALKKEFKDHQRGVRDSSSFRTKAIDRTVDL